jgi:hypothetical protein
MTAVEWLVQKTELTDFWKEEIQQAIEMEKEQIKSAFIQGDMFSVDYYDGINPTENNYYSETYKKDNI